jgi:hypothetical protein
MLAFSGSFRLTLIEITFQEIVLRDQLYLQLTVVVFLVLKPLFELLGVLLEFVLPTPIDVCFVSLILFE